MPETAGGVHMASKLARTQIEREPGYLYFLDGAGDVARVRMRRGARSGRPQKVERLGVERDPAYLYFIDADGDVARTRKANPPSE